MKRYFVVFLLILPTFFITTTTIQKMPTAQVNMGEYCYSPPTIAMEIPPLVMLAIGRDHKLYYEAYNDASDLDGDGRVDVGYKHSIDYYGYFDPYKCYVYGNNRFEPTGKTSDKYCSNAWSGNFLNWLTMSRMDVLRKVLYGGYRETDSANTVLAGAYIPQDAHSWGKEISNISGERSYVPNIDKLTPLDIPTPANRRHLFCVVSRSDGATPVIRVLTNRTQRIWQWASKGRPVCDNSFGTPTEYNVKVEVCSPGMLEPNCKEYCTPGGGGCTHKPIGLLQKYTGSDRTKVCSKSLKSCNSDSDCNINTDGLCIDKAKMYFGLITGSYTKNLSGGVLRKNIWTLMDEINLNNGTFKASENTEGNIILTLERMRVVGFRYSDYSYQGQAHLFGSCGWITTEALTEGRCRMWGNPTSEMMYEALRYLAGKGSATSQFTYSGTHDSTLNLSKPDWGIKKGSTYYHPYQLFPRCAKPFMLVLSDINPSYDSDFLPGSYFGGTSGDLTGLNVSTLANTISINEGISGNYFIGQSGTLYDFICSSKNITGFSSIRGLCPEEPTKQGSYYSASIAYYGKTQWNNNFPVNKPPNVTSYSVALASPMPDIKIKVGNNYVRIVPIGKSVSGCLRLGNNPGVCAQRCTLTRDTEGKLIISNCQSGSYCPSNQIVDFYIDNINYNPDNSISYAKFRINFEDVEQGADHDMDAVIDYEIQTVGNNLNVRLTSEYAAGCIDQVLGFIISGTNADGTYLVVKDRDVSAADHDTPSAVAGMGLTWSKTFTVTGTPAGQLRDPLWYAAKWGGFNDMNGNNIPDLQSEWDADSDGNPDTYFLVINPLKMEHQLEKAFLDILSRASSGSTVATIAPRGGISTVIVQPYFYPSYQAHTGEIKWLGFLRSFWIDLKQNLREDTVINKILDIVETVWDKIIQFITEEDETKIAVLKDDTDKCELEAKKELEEVIPVFDSACKLAEKDASQRTIKYNKDGNLFDFTTANSSDIASVWQTVDKTIDSEKAACIIRYLRGENLSGDSTCKNIPYVQRPREIDISNFGCGSGIKTWKLGDIINSSPSIVSNQPANVYHIRYNDSSYRDFIKSDDYKKRVGLVFVGANDGMLHAFRVGTVINQTDPKHPSKLQNAPEDTGTDKIGQEEWAFIPRNAIAYLIWYGKTDYCHVPTVDYRTQVVDAKIENTWKTLLIGVMGFGGKELNVYSSSIFVLDITNPLSPSLLWERTLSDKTLTLSFPAVVKVKVVKDNWYLVVGTGPKDPKGTSFTTAKLYFLNLKDGGSVKTLTIKEGGSDVSAAVGDIMPVDVDDDYSDDVVYFGTYTSNSGDFYRISLKNKPIEDLTDNDIKKAVAISRPVFAASAFTKDEAGKLWVFFGTGRYLDDSDKVIPDKNYLVGFKDPCWDGKCSNTYKLKDFTERDSNTAQVTAKVTQTKKICQCSSSGCALQDVVSQATPVSAITEVKDGWYYLLPNEAVISQPIIYRGIVYTLSFAPPQDICAFGGSSSLLSLYYKSGTAYPVTVFSPLATSNKEVGQQTTVYSKIFLGAGSPPLGNPFQIVEDKIFTQLSTAGIAPLGIESPWEEGFRVWIEK